MLLSNQLDVILESSKKLALTWVERQPKAMQSNKDHAVYSDFFSSKRKCKAEGYHAVCVQYVIYIACCHFFIIEVTEVEGYPRRGLFIIS